MRKIKKSRLKEAARATARKIDIKYNVDLTDFKKKYFQIRKMIRQLKKDLKSIKIG